MARRLNTLLHEMKLGPTAHMTTRDQLEALFRAEIDRMTDHLDSLVFAARNEPQPAHPRQRFQCLAEEAC